MKQPEDLIEDYLTEIGIQKFRCNRVIVSQLMRKYAKDVLWEMLQISHRSTYIAKSVTILLDQLKANDANKPETD